MNIKIAKNVGLCFGVRKAVELAETSVKKYKIIYSLGPLMHNKLEVERLKKLNVIPIEDLRDIKSGKLLLRTHGLPKDEFEDLKLRKNIDIIDATCPIVKKSQNIVKSLSGDNYKILIMGEKEHPEVKALKSYNNGNTFVVNSINELKNIKLTGDYKIVLISQTTQSIEKFETFKDYLLKTFKKIKIYNTICRETIKRQAEAKKLAMEVDLMIIVGGKNSANTRVLYEICKEYTTTYWVEEKTELKSEWFKGVSKVGLIGGTSTPKWLINEVYRGVREITN